LSVRFVVAFSIFFLEFLGQAISGKDNVTPFCCDHAPICCDVTPFYCDHAPFCCGIAPFS